MRVEHEYERGDALAYLTALDVHAVFGRCEASTGLAPFARLVEQVMTREPYASARRLFWIVDNGSSHRGQASIDGTQRRHVLPATERRRGPSPGCPSLAGVSSPKCRRLRDEATRAQPRAVRT
jgi:hypothetical protein